jgi:hypothetical protein
MRHHHPMATTRTIPEPARLTLQQRLDDHAHKRWPQLDAVTVRFRGQFAYVAGRLPGGEVVPLCRLRYAGSASQWGFGIYLASKDGYDEAAWPFALAATTPEEALDTACGLYLGGPAT